MSVQYSAIHDGQKMYNKNFPTQEQIDAVVAARRNPLTPEMERARSNALKKYSVPKVKDVLYHLCFKRPSDTDCIPFYVGICREDRMKDREREHMDGIANHANLKDAYCFGREMIEEGYSIHWECVGEADSVSETDLLIEYISLGFPMRNDVDRTVSIKRKKKRIEDVAKAMTPKQTANKAFRDMMKSPDKLQFKPAK